MGRRETVTSPDGARWRVRRRWLDQPLPDLKRRWQENSMEAKGESGLEILSGASNVENAGVALAVAVGLAVFILIVLPLLGVALELVALLLVLLVSLLGRLLLGRPWIVEAENLDDRQRSTAFAVRGWRRAGDAVSELEAALAASDLPPSVTGAETIYPPSRRLPWGS